MPLIRTATHRKYMTGLVPCVFLACCCTFGCHRSNTAPKQGTPGGPKSAKTNSLEAGAIALQPKGPINQFDVYLVGFHPMKDAPNVQMEAHHYCSQANEDFAQCVLFDGNTKDAHLNGIEYIISEKLYRTLPAEEQQYWHPHNYEVLSGQLIAPGIPQAAEHSLMSEKINSYGKTWHVWETDNHGKPDLSLPLGPPHLAWSFNHDGEIDPAMIKERDNRMQVDTREKRKSRQDLQTLAHPQQGVDALHDELPHPRKDTR